MSAAFLRPLPPLPCLPTFVSLSHHWATFLSSPRIYRRRQKTERQADGTGYLGQASFLVLACFRPLSLLPSPRSLFRRHTLLPEPPEQEPSTGTRASKERLRHRRTEHLGPYGTHPASLTRPDLPPGPHHTHFQPGRLDVPWCPGALEADNPVNPPRSDLTVGICGSGGYHRGLREPLWSLPPHCPVPGPVPGLFSLSIVSQDWARA